MNLLITGAWLQAKQYFTEIEKDHVVKFLQYEKSELPCNPEWAEGIIGNGIFLYHPIEKFVNLRYIQLTSAGFDRVPMKYVRDNNIKIYNARGVYSIPMAEYAVSGVLNIYKKMSFFMENKKNHRWEKNRELRELSGKTVCIVGCGSVGYECAKRFEAMGCTIFGIDPVAKEHTHFTYVYHNDDIEYVLKKSDVVIVTLPLTEHTVNMFDSQLFSVMKKNAVFVNIARGALIRTEALLKELESGRISAVLDVFDEEPLKEDSPFWSLENVIITPHNSFVGEGNGFRMSNVIMKNLQEYTREDLEGVSPFENSGHFSKKQDSV